MKYAAISAAFLLSGCMTIEKLPTASTYDVFEAACMSKATSFEVQQAALQELTRRGHTCRDVAAQVLQIRAANPQVFAPVQTYQQQPYFTPTQPSAQVQQPQGVHATLVGQSPTSSPTGQAYMCQYRTGTGLWQVVRPVADGPCPPTANLR